MAKPTKGVLARKEKVEHHIDSFVDRFFPGNADFATLLKETAAKESKFGDLDQENVFQVDQGERETLMARQFQPMLAHLGARRNDDGTFIGEDLQTNMALAAMRYLRNDTHGFDISTPNGRAGLWKKVYNTDEGKGTVDSFLEMREHFYGK